jgi:hypothetical protein
VSRRSLEPVSSSWGIERTTLLEQLQHFETHIGATLYRRATAQSQAHRQPAQRGARLLNTLAWPDVQALRAARIRLPRHHSRLTWPAPLRSTNP